MHHPGPPRFVHVGESVELAPRAPDRSARYRWRVVDRPDGSDASVGGAPVVHLAPDRESNLAEILQGLANVIRARFKLFRKVKAITAEAKFSGTFLSFFPILCLIGINVAQPDYYADVIDTPAFIPACAVVAVMLAVNMIFMRILVNIKV